MEQVVSRDGTPIAYDVLGAGPPLVLVHGSGAANPLVGWQAAAAGLAEHCTLYALDRRGYRASGDGAAYALAREFEDVAALVESTGAPTALLGHSFGALCALGAALLARHVARLVLYEPAISFPGRPFYGVGVIERVQALLDAGDREAVLDVVYGEIAGLTPDEIAQFRAAPTWPDRLRHAHLIVRESWAEQGYGFDAARFARLTTPTLLLSGSDSAPPIQAVTAAVHAALPNSRIAVLPGQGHLAMYTAPDLFVKAVLAFLAEDI